MEALIVGLVVTAVTGLAWFAYHHPVQFRPIAVYLKAATIIFFGFAAVWGIAANQAFVVLLPFIDDNDAARAQIIAMTMDWLWGPLAVLATLGYLQFLDSFVTTLKHADK